MSSLSAKLTELNLDWIEAQWEVPSNIRALVTTRRGGVSLHPYASMNLGEHVGDSEHAVTANRLALAGLIETEPFWATQVHGIRVVEVEGSGPGVQADACIARRPGMAAAVLIADCLPVLLADASGSVVAAAHAGWRGLSEGVLEATTAAMGVAPDRILAWMGPAIGPRAFEVGPEVLAAFGAHDAAVAACFTRRALDRWLGNLYALARLRLMRAGVRQIYGGGYCTFEDAGRFYSYRRERCTGRMAALIWMTETCRPRPPV